MKKQGTIKVIAKTGGIIFEEEDGVWYNPIEVLKKPLKDDWKKYKGNKVEITLTEQPNEFNNIVVLEKKGYSGKKTGGKGDDENTPVNTTQLNKNRLIVRQTCIKAAVEAYAADPTKFGTQTIATIAAEFEKYIYSAVGGTPANVTEEQIEG